MRSSSAAARVEKMRSSDSVSDTCSRGWSSRTARMPIGPTTESRRHAPQKNSIGRPASHESREESGSPTTGRRRSARPARPAHGVPAIALSEVRRRICRPARLRWSSTCPAVRRSPARRRPGARPGPGRGSVTRVGKNSSPVAPAVPSTAACSASAARLRSVMSSAVKVTPRERSSGSRGTELIRTSKTLPSLRRQRVSSVPTPAGGSVRTSPGRRTRTPPASDRDGGRSCRRVPRASSRSSRRRAR